MSALPDEAETAAPPSTLDELLAAGIRHDDRWHYPVGADWMQGRTAYGGLSAALALDAALRDYPGEAPLRSAQVSFVGPVGGACAVATRMLRESKSSRFIAADVTSESGYGTNALFTFMKPRQSHIDFHSIPVPAIADPDHLAPIPDHPARPAFTRKFDMRPGRGPTFGHAQSTADILTWVRWIDTPICAPSIALFALADALPPAAITLFQQFGPVSSSTWTQHFLTDTPQSVDGWWLLASASETVRRGFSVQTMMIWNSDRELVSVGSQGVALYV